MAIPIFDLVERKKLLPRRRKDAKKNILLSLLFQSKPMNNKFKVLDYFFNLIKEVTVSGINTEQEVCIKKSIDLLTNIRVFVS